jgi:hypothetical protein
MEKGSCGTETGDSMKAFGTETSGMAKGSRGIQTAILTSDSLNMERHMAKESILGKMAKYMMENGTKVSSKVTAFGKASKMIPTSESGTLPRHMATVCIPGPMATSMRASGRCASSMDREQILSYRGMSIPESMSTVSHREEESTLGLIGRYIPENLLKD